MIISRLSGGDNTNGDEPIFKYFDELKQKYDVEDSSNAPIVQSVNSVGFQGQLPSAVHSDRNFDNPNQLGAAQNSQSS